MHAQSSRRTMRKFWTGLAAAATALTVAVGAAGTAEAATPASNSVGVLMQSFNAGTGRIGTDWWTSAVSLSTVMTYRQATGDTQYDSAISEAFAKNGDFTNEYVDDTGWWALVWIQAYDITGNRSYLSTAETLVRYMHDYWDSTCGGGVYWKTDRRYKASIANELYLAATAGLHNRLPGDTTYLAWANEEWNWLRNTGVISNNLVRDGITIPSCGYSTAVYTYNQGVILQGLIELSKATGNTALLSTARSIATAGVARFNRNNVLYEGCEPNCSGDGQAFKGIFIRYLRALATQLRTTEYDAFITTTANSILANNTDGAGRQGNSFVGPFALWSPTTQAASAAALIAALGSGPPPSNPPATGVLRGAESGRCVDVPGATQTNSTRVALWDCNGGTNQRWVATGSRQLQVYGTRCLDVSGGSTANGAAVIIYDCHAGANQQWTVNADGTVVSAASGKCLDATGHGTTNGTLLAIWTCNGGANQRWARS